MIYVMSDLHGCYEQYKKALELISFGEDDLLYLLGDVIDRGPDSMKLLKDMMMRPNVIPIIGNHEYMALKVLRKLCVEITEENRENHLTAEDLISYSNWTMDGGNETIEQFRTLSKEEQTAILEYLMEFSLYEEVEAGGKEYILVHGGLSSFDSEKEIDDYHISEMIFEAPDYEKVYFADRYLVTGHQPTVSQGEEYQGKIIQKNNHIAIDCGCVFGYGLGIFCLDNGKEWYVR